MIHSTGALLDVYVRRMGLPIVGVSIGRKDDRSTWRLQFSSIASRNDRDKEADTIASFDEEAETILARESDAQSRLDEDALVVAMLDAIASATSLDADALKAEVVARLQES